MSNNQKNLEKDVLIISDADIQTKGDGKSGGEFDVEYKPNS
jgi:hypothetical protein